jgi:cation:H+ antiporter
VIKVDLILFLLFIVITIILNIKLSYYADVLDKNTKLGTLIIGGLLLASITNLPELIIGLSHVLSDVPRLAINNILNSNIFNFLIIIFFDIIYFKRKLMDKVSTKYLSIHLILIYMYLGIISYFEGNLVGSIYNIGMPSIIIFLGFLAYIMVITNTNIEEEDIRYHIYEKQIGLKMFLIILAIIITNLSFIYYLNNILQTYLISSIVIKTSFLSIMMILPELVSANVLIKKENYNLMYANIIGSIMINLVILTVCDLFLSSKIIYDFFDNSIFLMAHLCLWFTIIMIYSVIRKKSWNNISYIIPSIALIIIYIFHKYIILFLA